MTAGSSRAPEIVPARPEHAAAIVEVIRAGFDAAAIELTIYGSARIVNWIRAHIQVAESVAERVYTVAGVGGDVIGCVELATRWDAIFLSYISVLPAHRVSGLGARLLGQAIRRVRQPAQRTMRLDVFVDNKVAVDWYHRLGFVHQATSLLCDATSLLPPPRVAGRPIGVPTAQAAHEAFGFSELEVETTAGRNRVGRLGNKWWRVPAGLGPSGTAAILADTDLLATLHALDPARGLMVSVPGSHPPAGATELLRMLRMEAPLDQLEEGLPR